MGGAGVGIGRGGCFSTAGSGCTNDRDVLATGGAGNGTGVVVGAVAWMAGA